MKQITFYQRDPGIFRSIGWLGYGITPWLAPGILPAAIIDNATKAVSVSGMTYLITAAALTYPTTQKYVIQFHKLFWNRFRRHILSRKISSTIRKTLLHSGLVVREYREVIEKGRTQRKEIVHYSAVEIRVDEVNLYLQFRMLAGQTEQEWERKITAFAHALECNLVSFQIKRGMVNLTLQHGEIQADSVTYKTDTAHTLTIGYATDGRLIWDFEQFPHALIVGPTGTGKSTFIRNLLIQLQQTWTVKVADGKQVEFTHLRDFGLDVATDTAGFLHLVIETQAEVDRRFQMMQQKKRNHYTEINEIPYFLVIDEAIYLLEALSTKKNKDTGESERDYVLNLLRDISLRGRAAGVQLIMIFQRPDSSFIPTVIRDNLMAKVVLGGSETALEMTFGKEKSKALDPIPTGHGYACIGDRKVEVFRFPDYTQKHFLNDLEDKITPVAKNEPMLHKIIPFKMPADKIMNE